MLLRDAHDSSYPQTESTTSASSPLELLHNNGARNASLNIYITRHGRDPTIRPSLCRITRGKYFQVQSESIDSCNPGHYQTFATEYLRARSSQAPYEAAYTCTATTHNHLSLHS